MIDLKNWETEHVSLVKDIFKVQPLEGDKTPVNINRRELSKPVVFLIKKKEDPICWVQYHGFHTILEASAVLVKDMTDAAYRGSGIDNRYSLVNKDTEIVGTLFQGKVIRLHPVTSHVAVLIKDPAAGSTDESARFEEFDTLAGSIPYINLEVIDNARKESEDAEKINQDFNHESSGQEELSNSEGSNDA